MDCHKDKARICANDCPRFVPGKTLPPSQVTSTEPVEIPDQCLDNIATQYLTKLCHVAINALGPLLEKAVKK